MEKKSPETAPNNTPLITTSAQQTTVISQTLSEVVAFAVQCNICYKWRTLTEEHFEDIRCNQTKDPFICTKLPGITCGNPADINYNDSSKLWAMDTPDIPKTPNGFKRNVRVRSDCSRAYVEYISPQGKRIRTGPGVAEYLLEHPECSHLSQSDFCFISPKITREMVPNNVVKNPVTSTRKKRKLK